MDKYAGFEGAYKRRCPDDKDNFLVTKVSRNY